MNLIGIIPSVGDFIRIEYEKSGLKNEVYGSVISTDEQAFVCRCPTNEDSFLNRFRVNLITGIIKFIRKQNGESVVEEYNVTDSEKHTFEGSLNDSNELENDYFNINYLDEEENKLDSKIEDIKIPDGAMYEKEIIEEYESYMEYYDSQDYLEEMKYEEKEYNNNR